MSVALCEKLKKKIMCYLAANFLASTQTLLVSTSCSSISLLARCSGLPLPKTSTKQDATLQSENPFNINKSDTNIDDVDVTKFTVADRYVIHRHLFNNLIQKCQNTI